ncbi:MAG: exo-alpha-sialidase, partial [Candidatus Promineifilaceae bacterium]
MSKLAQKLAIVFLWFVLLGTAVLLLNPGRTVGAQEGEIATAEPCGDPTLQSIVGNVNVREGPGLEYDVIGTLATFEVRPVIGRAGFSEWWLVELASGESGWVAADAAAVQGNIAALDIVEAPTLADGTTPTPGAAWNPASDVNCATSEAEATPTSETPSEWTTPNNLSHSGGSSDPRMVVDSNGEFHVIWKDETEGFIYIHGNGTEWSDPVSLELPFGTRIYYPDLNETEETPLFVPQLVADQNGNIHALWIDDENGLYYSSVAAENFGTFSAWTTRQSLASAALQLDIGVDNNGFLHLAYVRPDDTEEAPAGVYYRQSVDNGGAWSTAAPVYLSRYFHSTAAEDVNIDLTTTRSEEVDQVLIAWDNRPLGRVFAAHSGDNGQTWDQPFQVDGREPEDSTEATNPGHISVGAMDNQAIVIWQAGHNGEICGQYYRTSLDGGQNWGPRQALERPRGCHQSDQFITTDEGYLVLVALVDEVTGTKGYLLAWNGQKWSEPQEQTTLTTFENPQTYLEIAFQCQQSMAINPNTLMVIGCDGGAGKDIWLARRTISDIVDWFPVPAVWLQPAVAGTQQGEITGLNVQADADGLLHVIWAQNGEAEIYYASYNELFWTQPTAISRALDGNSGQPVTVLDNNGRLLLAWTGIDSGQIYFSWAETARSLTPADWALAQVVSEPGLVAQSPQIVVDQSGIIYIVYAVPLNEERGIYLVRSEDRGETWSPTVKVFDGAASGWTIVDRPHLTVTANGNLHLLITRYQKPDEDQPLAIFYTRSEDQGESWTSPVLTAEEPVLTGDLIGVGLQTLHRLWFIEGNSGLEVWHDLSIDDGRSWSNPTSATGFGGVGEPMSIMTDAAGRIHLLGLMDNAVQHWMWEDNRWNVEDNAPLPEDLTSNIYALGGTTATNGDLAVVYAVEGDETTLYYT